MSITAAFTTIIGALSSPAAIAGTTLLTGANTVMNAVELKNDADIKSGINCANSRLIKVQDSLDELQGICESTCTVDDLGEIFKVAPPTQTTQSQHSAPATQVAPPVQKQDSVPDWAKVLFDHQKQQDAFMANIASMLKKPDTDAAPTQPVQQNVYVGSDAAAAPSTETPAETAPTTAPASVPADEAPAWFKAYLTAQEAKEAAEKAEFKNSIESLFKATAELKAEVDKTDTKKK